MSDSFELTTQFADVVMADVSREWVSAMQKFPQWPENNFEGLAILTEEVGELANAFLELKHRHKTEVTESEVYSEAVQVAAMAIRIAQSILVKAGRNVEEIVEEKISEQEATS